MRDLLTPKRFKKESIIAAIAVAALLLSIANTAWPIIAMHRQKTEQRFLLADDDKKINEIESYLDAISPELINTVQALAEENKVPSWGCGPSSYALAKILNKKFFDDKLPIGATYHGNSHEIVERFSFAFKDLADKNNSPMVDHAWLEIYFNNRFLYVDPTIGQFGNYNKIEYQLFNVGDPGISTTLLEKYGLADIRLKTLVQKVVNRVPAAQEPYPGISLSPSTIDYYLQSVQERDAVDSGHEPLEWKSWVDALSKKIS